jgi:hypothetical protein
MGTSVTSFRDGNSPRHKTISERVYPSMKLRLRTSGLLAADLWCPPIQKATYTAAHFPKFVLVLQHPPFANFEKSWAPAKLMIPVPLFYLKILS